MTPSICYAAVAAPQANPTGKAISSGTKCRGQASTQHYVMLWRCRLHLQTTVSGLITLPLVTSRFYTEDKNKPCAASHTERQTMHFAYLRIKAERFSQLTEKVEKAAVEKPRLVTVRGLRLVQSISAQNRSLFPFISLQLPAKALCRPFTQHKSFSHQAKSHFLPFQ